MIYLFLSMLILSTLYAPQLVRSLFVTCDSAFSHRDVQPSNWTRHQIGWQTRLTMADIQSPLADETKPLLGNNIGPCPPSFFLREVLTPHVYSQFGKRGEAIAKWPSIFLQML